ncbi:MAG: uroporphyrinogen decarboxylase family protein [Candidatus Latescibacterota bacterium]
MMTPRERMQAFLNGKPVDRIPNGLGGCETAGLHNVAYHKLKSILGVDDPNNRVCTFMNNAIFEPSVLTAMEADIILLGSRMCSSRFWGPDAAKEWKSLHMWDIDLQVASDWEFRQDSDGTWWWGNNMCPPGALYFDPPAGQQVGSSFDSMENPSPDDFNPPHELPDVLLERFAQDAKWLHDHTAFAIACGEMIQSLQLRPGGTQSWWMRMVSDPEACHEFLGKAVDAAVSQIRQLDEAVGSYCMSLLIADDMGDTRGITIGPDLWRKIYKPHYERLFTEWHHITEMKVSLHSCGSMVDILDDLIECGVDIYNPVQTSANHMNPAILKERFGNRIIFYGGVFDPVSLHATTSPEIVYETIKSNIKILSKDGGYIFAGVHNLPGNVPEAHLEAMLAAYRDCRSDLDCRKGSTNNCLHSTG